MPIQSTIARKNFIRRVEIAGGQAISIGDLMRAAPAVTGTSAWGTNSDGSPSMDTFTADFVSAIPVTETLFIGYDLQVADADGVAAYMGAPIAAGDAFNSSHYIRGPVDADGVFFFSVNTQDLDLIFQGI